MSDETVFRKALHKEMLSANGLRHDDVNVVRVALWYSRIQDHLSKYTAYSIEQELEPEAFGKHEKTGDPYHWNKWCGYRIGRHLPRKDLVSRVNIRVPGSAVLLDHVLWEAIRGKKPVAQLWSKGLMQFAPDVLQAVVRVDAMGQTTGQLPSHLGGNRLRMLERRAGIDALACLTLLLRDAAGRGDQELAISIGRSLYSVLLIFCTRLPFYAFSAELFYLFRRHVFPLANSEVHAFDFDGFDFSGKVLDLITHLLRLEDNNLIGYRLVDGTRAMFGLVDGKYGLDLRLFFAPPIRWKNQRGEL